MYKYLITGAAGFLGKAVAERLVSRGESVIGVDNHSRHGKQDLSFPLVQSDLTKELSLVECETVIHFAAINGTATFYEKPYEVLEVGCRATFSAVEIARRCKAKLVVASSSEVYREPLADEKVPVEIPDITNPRFTYAASKVVTEMAALHSGLDALVIRPHNIFGPGAGDKHVIPQLIERARSCGETLDIYGDTFRAFCYIDNFVDALMLLLDKKAKGIYNVGTDEVISIPNLGRMILRLLGKDAEIVIHPAPEGSVSFRCPNILKLCSMGHRNSVGLEEGLRRTIG